jgi:hypothetical protein
MAFGALSGMVAGAAYGAVATAVDGGLAWMPLAIVVGGVIGAFAGQMLGLASGLAIRATTTVVRRGRDVTAVEPTRHYPYAVCVVVLVAYAGLATSAHDLAAPMLPALAMALAAGWWGARRLGRA